MGKTWKERKSTKNLFFKDIAFNSSEIVIQKVGLSYSCEAVMMNLWQPLPLKSCIQGQISLYIDFIVSSNSDLGD